MSENYEIIIVPKEKINFRRPNMRTKAGQDSMKEGEYYKRIKHSIETNGLINPLVCVKEGDEYIICLGNKRFIIGCDLGISSFPIIVAESEDKSLLINIRNTYKPTSSDMNLK